MNPDQRALERLRAHAAGLDRAAPAISPGEIRARAGASPPIRHGWRRARVVVVATIATVIVGVGALVVPIALRSDRDGPPSVISEPPATTRHPGAAVADRFVPPTFRDGPERVMPVTLLDGRRLELRYPPDLEVAELGVRPDGGIDWPVRSDPFRCCGSVLQVRYTTIDAVYRDAEPITTYPGADGRPVAYYHGSDAGRTTPFDYLVFEFGPWLVEVPDIQAPGDFEDRKTEEERATWARSLRGSIDPDGYLVLNPVPPLALQVEGELAVIGGPAAPGGPAIGLPHVELFSTEAVCAPDATKENSLERFEFETGNEVGAGWCDAEAGVRIRVSGPKDFVDQAVSGLDAKVPAQESMIRWRMSWSSTAANASTQSAIAWTALNSIRGRTSRSSTRQEQSRPEMSAQVSRRAAPCASSSPRTTPAWRSTVRTAPP